MDTYPCPVCGGVADAEVGCRSCGRPHDPNAAALARLNDETRRLETDQADLTDRRARLEQERAALIAAISQRLADEREDPPTLRMPPQPHTPPPGTTRPTGPTAPRSATAPTTPTPSGPRAQPGPNAPRPRPTGSQPRPRAAGTTPPRQRTPDPGPLRPTTRTGAPPRTEHTVPVGAETSPRSAQNALLTLGGVLVGLAAIIITAVFYTTTATGGRAAILALSTTVALSIAVLLARQRLTATAETIAGIGLLLVALDGYAAYREDLAGIRSVPPPLFSAILLALVATVAAAYRLATHLRAPQFATLLTVQPLLPLIGVQLKLGADGFAAVFGIVAALNLASVAILSQDPDLFLPIRPRISARRTGSVDDDAPDKSAWPRMLRELAWILFGAALAVAVGLSLSGLVSATTVPEAVRAAAPLLLAAAVGVAGGRVSGRRRVREIASGGAAIAILVAVSGVNYQALPDYILVVTAATATAIAIATNYLPERERRGPQIGALIGAALTAVVVTGDGLRTAVSLVRTAVTPEIWNADLAGYLGRVHMADWQFPAAAVLLAALGFLASPPSWKVDASIIGGAVVVFTLPGTGGVQWWAVPALAAAASTVGTATALYARTGRSAFIRSGTAAVLGVFALATSLARAELTAIICAVLTAVAVTTAVLAIRRPQRFGPYSDRVADAAGGAAAFTLPIAVGTFAHLAGAPARVLLPATLLATAVAVLAAALSQVAARTPRTASAGGALAAAAGDVILSLRFTGAEAADIGLALLLLAAAAVSAASRAFEVSSGGLVEGVEAIPAAVSALIDSVDNQVDRPERPTPRRVSANGILVGAALSTAALIVAMARLLAVAVPGIGLVTSMAMVLVVSLGVHALPERLKSGPRYGAGAVGGGLLLFTAAIAVTEAGRVVAANTPFWSADLTEWPSRVAGFAPYGWQVPASLVLAAAAAAALLPHPVGQDVGFVTLAIAGLSLPATAGLVWWSPALIALVFAVAAGIGAALVSPRDLPASLRVSPVAAPPPPPEPVRVDAPAFVVSPGGDTSPGTVTVTVAGPPLPPPATGDEDFADRVARGLVDTAHRRLALAGVLGLYATAAGAATTGSTALVLSAILAAGVIIAAIGQARGAPAVVPGVAAAASLVAAPGAAATIAIASGAGPTAVLGTALVLAAFGVPVLALLRAAQVRWGLYPALGVGAAALTVAIAALPQAAAELWAAAAALIAVGAAATLRTIRRSALVVIIATAVPAAAVAAAASAPAWLTALFGPYRTLRQIWHGYAAAPAPHDAPMAMFTLWLLALAAAAAALTLGGQKYVLAAVLPPLAALALLAPAALEAPRAATTWVALAVAVATGLGAALSPPTVPDAARLLRGTAGIVCAITGAAGLADSLATKAGTLGGLAVVLAAAALAALSGRDPAVRMVAWMVGSAAAYGLPVTALAAAGRPVRPAAFGLLVVCAVLVGTALLLARAPARRPEAAIVELSACIGAAFALLLTLGSVQNAAAVLTVCGLLLGAAALRRDRPAERRQWLVRAALGAEVGACWLLLYSVQVALTEAYTLPFAAVALLLGAIEMRRRTDLSSWVAYGPALAGGFLPSLALVLLGQDPGWRWVTVFLAAIATVILGAAYRLRAPVVTGAAIALVVALAEMIKLLVQGRTAGAVLVALAGVVLIVVGAISEQRLRSALR